MMNQEGLFNINSKISCINQRVSAKRSSAYDIDLIYKLNLTIKYLKTRLKSRDQRVILFNEGINYESTSILHKEL